MPANQRPDFTDFFEHGTLALHVVGPDGSILRANAAELELLGYDHDEYVGRSITLFHVDPETIADILRRLTAGERIRNYPARLRCKDGSIRHVLIDSSVRFEDGEFVHTRCFTRDVTSEVEAGRRADAAQRRLAFLATASGMLAASLDREQTLQGLARLLVPEIGDYSAVHTVEDDGTVSLVAVAHTDAAKESLARQWLGRHPLSPGSGVLDPAARPPGDLAALRGLGVVSAIVVPLSARDRTLGTITVFTAESGRTYGADDVALMEELAKRAALAVDNATLFAREQAARAAAETANRVKDEFLAVLSHELRTPLTAAHGWLRIMQAQQLDPERLKTALNVISRNVDLQLRLINDLLDVSALAAGKVELERRHVDLADLVSDEVESCKALAAANKVNAAASIDAPAPVFGDPARIRQAISNLLSNAIKFTPPGGRVDVVLRRAGADACISVIDTGRGIAPEFLPRVFEKFQQAEGATTRRTGGLGLGLAIVKSLIELHGGRVSAESDGVGKGARFTVLLPLGTPAGGA